jgi:hypothetical protein
VRFRGQRSSSGSHPRSPPERCATGSQLTTPLGILGTGPWSAEGLVAVRPSRQLQSRQTSSPMPYKGIRAASDAGLAPLGLRIIRAMQPSAARGETAGWVARRPSRLRRRARLSRESACEVDSTWTRLVAMQPSLWRAPKGVCSSRNSIVRFADGELASRSDQLYLCTAVCTSKVGRCRFWRFARPVAPCS